MRSSICRSVEERSWISYMLFSFSGCAATEGGAIMSVREVMAG
jgi:hypothetical protein